MELKRGTYVRHSGGEGYVLGMNARGEYLLSMRRRARATDADVVSAFPSEIDATYDMWTPGVPTGWKKFKETVRVGTSQACVLHGHPKKADSKTDKPAGSEIKCYPFSGEGGRAGAIKKAYAQHYAITKNEGGVGAKTLASAPTLERLIKLISEYFMGSTIRVDGENVFNAHGLIPTVRVVQKGGRFLFQVRADRDKPRPEESVLSGMFRLQEVLSGSEALYGFCGWLTSRPEKTVMSASDDAGGIADLVGEFSKVQGLPAPRDGWDKKELRSMNPVRRKKDAIHTEGREENGMARLEAAVALARGVHFKSKDWEEANKFSLSRRFPMVVMKGDDGEFWVVRPDDGERLAAAGYEFAR